MSRCSGGENFWIWTRNSVVVAIGTTLIGLLLAIPAGYAFSRYDFAGRKGSMFVFMVVQMFPGIIILVPYFLVMKTLGLLNSAIGLIIVYSVTALPLCVWMLKGFFDSVPRALEEAALLDGCTQVEVFFRIVLPLSLPAVAITALFSFITAWNEFLLALVFNTSNDAYTLARRSGLDDPDGRTAVGRLRGREHHRQHTGRRHVHFLPTCADPGDECRQRQRLTGAQRCPT